MNVWAKAQRTVRNAAQDKYAAIARENAAKSGECQTRQATPEELAELDARLGPVQKHHRSLKSRTLPLCQPQGKAKKKAATLESRGGAE